MRWSIALMTGARQGAAHGVFLRAAGYGLMAAALCGPPHAAAQSLAVGFTKTYSAMETDKLYRGFIEHVAQCTGASLVNHFNQPLAGRLYLADTIAEAQIPALLEAGRMQVAVVSSALATWLEARDIAELVAVRGQQASQQAETFELQLMVPAESGITSVAQLAGAKVGFPDTQAAAGISAPAQAAAAAGAPPLDNMLAMGALKRAGLTAGKDYKVEYAGGHERSLMGLQGGFWQGAIIGSDQFERMVKKREVKSRDFRVIWRSPGLPSDTVVMAKAVPAPLKAKIVRCVQSHRFTAEQSRLFEGSDALLPVSRELYAPYRALLQAKP